MGVLLADVGSIDRPYPVERMRCQVYGVRCGGNELSMLVLLLLSLVLAADYSFQAGICELSSARALKLRPFERDIRGRYQE